MCSVGRTVRLLCAAASLAVPADLAVTKSTQAQPSIQGVLRPNTISVRSELIEGNPTLSPMAYIRFCIANRDECKGALNAERLTLSEASRKALWTVNSSINRDVTPRIDSRHERPWTLNARAGDCNIFAIQKRHALLALGFPSNNVSLAVVSTRSGRGHLVVVVRSREGDIVLDNLRSEILPWSQSGYSWIKIQSVNDPQLWVAVNREPAPTTHRWASTYQNVAAISEPSNSLR